MTDAPTGAINSQLAVKRPRRKFIAMRDDVLFRYLGS